jgi:hypothetical protein
METQGEGKDRRDCTAVQGRLKIGLAAARIS